MLFCSIYLLLLNPAFLSVNLSQSSFLCHFLSCLSGSWHQLSFFFFLIECLVPASAQNKMVIPRAWFGKHGLGSILFTLTIGYMYFCQGKHLKMTMTPHLNIILSLVSSPFQASNLNLPLNDASFQSSALVSLFTACWPFLAWTDHQQLSLSEPEAPLTQPVALHFPVLTVSLPPAIAAHRWRHLPSLLPAGLRVLVS